MSMGIPLDLLINAIVAGLLLGGFYAAVTVGVSISFGMLDVVNIAHPAFIILGSYIAYIVNTTLGARSDPRRASSCCRRSTCSARRSTRSTTSPSRGAGRRRCAASPSSSACCSSPRSALILVFGVDYRYVEAPYIGPTWRIGFVDFPLRMLVPCVVSLLLVIALAAVPDAHLHRPRHPGRGAGPAGAAAAGGQPDPHQAHRLRHLDRARRRWPAPSSSSSSRSSRRSGASTSAACSPSACSAAWAACPAP